jgi:hypothetical protein
MRIAILIFTFFGLNNTYAEPELDRNATPFNAVGTIVSSSPVRDAPPHGLFNLFIGKEVESTVQNTEVKIIGKKTYGGFSGANIWYQVKPVNEMQADKERPLWIYGGIEGESQQVIINELRGAE